MPETVNLVFRKEADVPADPHGFTCAAEVFTVSGTPSPEIQKRRAGDSVACAHKGAEQGKEKAPEAGGTAVRGEGLRGDPVPCLHQRVNVQSKTHEVGHCCV